MRVLSVAGALLCAAACGGGTPSSNSGPVVPTAPSPVSAPFVAVGTVTVEGGSARDIRVGFVAVTPRSSWPAGSGSTDITGRFRVPLSNIPGFPTTLDDRPTIFAIAADWPRSVQPCAAWAVVEGPETTVDVRIVAGTSLITPAPPGAPARSITGTVFETTVAGRQPIAGAFVAFDTWDSPVAVTRSDADGRYTLCGVPPDWTPALWASKDGYTNSSYYNLQPGKGDVVDIELRRR